MAAAPPTGRPAAPARVPPARGLLLVVALGLLLSLPVQAARGLYRADEGRYVGVALRMLDTGDWMHPQLDHVHAHWSKPPLTYWILASSMGVLGRNEFAARLPNALALLGTLGLIWLAASRLQPDRPWLAPVLYSVCLFPRIAAYVVTADTLLTLFTTMTVAGFVAWRFHADRPRRFLLLMWVGVALGFLTKGPPALLPLLGILAFTAWQDGWRAVGRLRWGAGLLVFVPIGLGWYACVVLGRPGLFSYFLGHEVADRLFSGAHHRNPDPLYLLEVYLPVLLLGTFPWIVQAVRGVWRALGRARDAHHGETRLLLCCLLVPTAVFFAVPSRLPLYLLQVFPALLLLAALAAPSGSLRGRFTSAWVAALVLLGSAAFVAARWVPTDWDTRMLAAEIRTDVPFQPGEVVFLKHPHRGLSLYLGCEVEVVALRAAAGSDAEDLEQELAESEPRQVFCIRAREQAAFLAEAARLGTPMRHAGRWRGLHLYCLARRWPVG